MSKAVTLTLPHELGRAEAKRRIEEGFGSMTRSLGAAAGALTKSWDGDRLTFALQALGQGISGTIDVDDTAVRMEVLLPTLLALMAEKVRGRLQRDGQLLLEKK